MKRHWKILVLLYLLGFILTGHAQTGREIADLVEEQTKTNSVQARIEMRLIDNAGNIRTRVFDQYMVEEGEAEKAVLIFQSPAQVQGTRFLLLKDEDNNEDRWIYLPNLRKSRRIAGSEGSDAFMSSEFSYDDIAGTDPNDYSFRILEEGLFQGEESWLVEAAPKDPADSAYGKTLSWISKSRYIALQVQMFDKAGELYKTMEAKNVVQVQGIWTPVLVVMKNIQSGNATELEIQKLIYNASIPDIFTQSFLQTGKY